MAKSEPKERTYNILVYGIEKKRLELPDADIKNRNYTLTFGPYNTHHRFNGFDGVILFQGIFESLQKDSNYGYYSTDCDTNELDKRLKEVDLLTKNGGFICILLCDTFVDQTTSGNCAHTDMAKVLLSPGLFNRWNLGRRLTNVNTLFDEFRIFLGRYGAASNYFRARSKAVEYRSLAKAGDRTVGLVLFDQLFFVPTLIPDNRPDIVEDYFKLLAGSLTSLYNKLIIEVPKWVDEFKLGKEQGLIEKKEQLEAGLKEVKGHMNDLRDFKKVLVGSSDALVTAVVGVLKKGFGFKVDSTDEYKEDIKILNDEGEPIVLVEVKGINKGIKRPHVNQCDSHRSESGFSPEFPSILIANTHIKNARNITEKDKEVDAGQIKRATNDHVLILRTLDLLRLLDQLLTGKIDRDTVLSILTTKSGWLKVSEDKYEILTE